MNLKFRRKDTPPEFPDVVTWAAWLYYIDQMTQIDVAKAIGVSRASVVNYLQEARERGLVSIHFDQKSISETVISKSLIEKYGLSSCLVIPKTVERSNLSERLGVAAARVLFSMLKSNDVISVAWGKTVLAAAQSIPHSELENLTVVQVVGKFSFDCRVFSRVLHIYPRQSPERPLHEFSRTSNPHIKATQR